MDSVTAEPSGPPPQARQSGWRRVVAAWDPTPLQIALVYAVFGFGALYVSDVLFVRWVEGTAQLQQMQAFKGGVEIVVTAGLLFALARRSRANLDRKNQQLARARAELDVLHRVLRHNLRNDVNVITGATALAREECTSEVVTEQCDRIRATAEKIVHYVDQAKKIRALTHGRRTRTTVDAEVMVERLIENYPALEREGVRLSSEIEDVPPVLANPRIEDAIGDLLDNAVTHTDRDRPRIDVSVTRSTDGPGCVAVRIADDGPGIPEQERRAINQRVERPLTHSCGMGLWFASWAALVSGGDLEITDNDPRGSVVTFHLPIDPSHRSIRERLLPAGRPVSDV